MTSTLDATRLVAALGQASRRFDVDLLPQCDSTNSMLLSRAEVGAASGTVVAATLQTAGVDGVGASGLPRRATASPFLCCGDLRRAACRSAFHWQ